MEGKLYRSIPNRVVLCVNEMNETDIAGELVHMYTQENIKFRNSMQMYRIMEELYNRLNYPQMSVKTRGFVEEEKTVKKEEAVRCRKTNEILQERGVIATFAVDVMSRQNATWQGEICWLERGITLHFLSLMELLAMIDNALKTYKNIEP